MGRVHRRWGCTEWWGAWTMVCAGWWGASGGVGAHLTKGQQGQLQPAQENVLTVTRSDFSVVGNLGFYVNVTPLFFQKSMLANKILPNALRAANWQPWGRCFADIAVSSFQDPIPDPAQVQGAETKLRLA